MSLQFDWDCFSIVPSPKVLKPSFDYENGAWSEAMLEKYERVSLQLRLIAEEVESDPKSEAFRYFMNMAQIELEQMREQQNSMMSDYGLVFKAGCDKFMKNERSTQRQ